MRELEEVRLGHRGIVFTYSQTEQVAEFSTPELRCRAYRKGWSNSRVTWILKVSRGGVRTRQVFERRRELAKCWAELTGQTLSGKAVIA